MPALRIRQEKKKKRKIFFETLTSRMTSSTRAIRFSYGMCRSIRTIACRDTHTHTQSNNSKNGLYFVYVFIRERDAMQAEFDARGF